MKLNVTGKTRFRDYDEAMRGSRAAKLADHGHRFGAVILQDVFKKLVYETLLLQPYF
jgi:hypothetical protein